jgi:hypothetical protein
MKHLILGLLVFSLIVAAAMTLRSCAAVNQTPDVPPGIELDVDVDRAKPRKTLKPKTPAPAPKGTKR